MNNERLFTHAYRREVGQNNFMVTGRRNLSETRDNFLSEHRRRAHSLILQKNEKK